MTGIPPVREIPIPTEECAICLEQVYGNNPTETLKCQHVFHKHCLKNWLQRQFTCPTCRHSIDKLGFDQIEEESYGDLPISPAGQVITDLIDRINSIWRGSGH